MRRFRWREYKKGIVPNPFSFRWSIRIGRIAITVCSPWCVGWVGTTGIKGYVFGLYKGIEIDLYFISIGIAIWRG